MNGLLNSLWSGRGGSPRHRTFLGVEVLHSPARPDGQHRPLPALERLEARDVPSASSPVYATLVSVPGFDASTGAQNYDQINFTYNGMSLTGGGVQLGMKLSSSPTAPPAGTTPDFYAFCVDVTHPINLNSPYLVQPTSASSNLHNGAAIAYLYNRFSSPFGSPLPKDLAAGLQLAIWEEEYGANFQVTSVVDLGNNKADVTDSVQAIASYYLSTIPCNVCAQGTFYDGTLGGTVTTSQQGIIGPPTKPPCDCFHDCCDCCHVFDCGQGCDCDHRGDDCDHHGGDCDHHGGDCDHHGGDCDHHGGDCGHSGGDCGHSGGDCNHGGDCGHSGGDCGHSGGNCGHGGSDCGHSGGDCGHGGCDSHQGRGDGGKCK